MVLKLSGLWQRLVYGGAIMVRAGNKIFMMGPQSRGISIISCPNMSMCGRVCVYLALINTASHMRIRNYLLSHWLWSFNKRMHFNWEAHKTFNENKLKSCGKSFGKSMKKIKAIIILSALDKQYNHQVSTKVLMFTTNYLKQLWLRC